VNDGLQWTDWPAARSPWKAGLAVAIIAVIAGVVGTVDWFMGLLGTLLLLNSISDFLFPTRFSVNEFGVSARSLLRSANRPWDLLGNWSRQPTGFSVAGRSSKRLLRRLRGVEIRCFEQQGEVEELLRQYLGPSVSETSPCVENKSG
jgi:hypothetical protein